MFYQTLPCGIQRSMQKWRQKGYHQNGGWLQGLSIFWDKQITLFISQRLWQHPQDYSKMNTDKKISALKTGSRHKAPHLLRQLLISDTRWRRERQFSQLNIIRVSSLYRGTQPTHKISCCLCAFYFHVLFCCFLLICLFFILILIFCFCFWSLYVFLEKEEHVAA